MHLFTVSYWLKESKNAYESLIKYSFRTISITIFIRTNENKAICLMCYKCAKKLKSEFQCQYPHILRSKFRTYIRKLFATVHCKFSRKSAHKLVILCHAEGLIMRFLQKIQQRLISKRILIK